MKINFLFTILIRYTYKQYYTMNMWLSVSLHFHQRKYINISHLYDYNQT